MTLQKLLLAGSTVLAFFHPFSTAAAQENPAAAKEIVVTGRAGASDRQRTNTSYALTTISEEQLRLAAPLSVAETFKSIPGFWVEASGGEASNNVRTRGIPTDGYSSVTIQEDGLTIQHDGGLGWLNADQSFRLDDTIKRVEAVRGGPSSIFASNATGGTVNFITRKAGDEPEGLVRVQVGDYGMYRTDFFYGAPLGGDWGLTIGGFYRSDEGIRHPGFRQNQGGQIRVGLSRDFDGGSFSVNVKHINDNVGFLLPIPLTFNERGDIAEIPGFDGNYGTLAGPDNRLVSFRNVNGPFAFDLSRGTDVSLTAITGRLELDLGKDWELQATARYRTSDIVRNGLFPTGAVETSQARLDGLLSSARAAYPTATGLVMRYATTGEALPTNANGNGLVISGNLLSVSVPLDEYVQDVRLARTFDLGGQTHDVAFGVYVADYRYDYDRFMATANLEVRDRARRLDILAVNAAGAVVGSVTENGFLRYGSLFDNASIEARALAFYASDEWQITPQFRLDLGVRHETIDMSGAVEGKRTVDLGIAGTLADNQVFTGTGQFVGIDLYYSNTSFTIGANFNLADSLGVFARYTDTARLPAPSEYQGSVSDAVRTDIRITPVTMIEGGVQWESDLLDLYATVFKTKYENVRFTDNIFNTTTNSFTTRVGYANTDTYGVELEGVIRPHPIFDLSAALAWQNPEYEDFEFTENVGGAPVTRSFSGNQLIRVPKVGLRAAPGLNLFDRALRVEAPIEHYSKRFADAANSQSLPAYTVYNLNARWNVTDTLSLSLNGVNLSNEIGLTEGNPRAGQFVSGDARARFFTARPILGRSWRVGATYRF
jgi:outer membrane receptor protein involved in Fe transport